jgi:hypothetical protein
MVDPGTGLTILGGAIGSKELIQKILGPTADYLGEGAANWTKRGVQNLGRVFANATKKLGDQVDRPGAVPPKVLKGILEEAPFCDDELGAEYFGGVLASSRTEVGRDDRGAAFLALIGRLSTYQIRSHYFFYDAVRELYGGLVENLGVLDGRQKLRVFVPMESFALALECGNGENFGTLLPHVMFGLVREALIETEFLFGDPGLLKSRYPRADVYGILFSPSVLGVELFLWAHGKGSLHTNEILNPAAIDVTFDVQISTTPGIRSTEFPDRILT